VKNNFYL